MTTKRKWKFCIDCGIRVCDEICEDRILKPLLYPECNNDICIKFFTKKPKKHNLKTTKIKRQKLQVQNKPSRLKLSVKSQRIKLRIKS